MNEINFATVKGEYLPEIIKVDGSIVRPFGDTPLPNMILDTFFASILNGYSFGIQSFLQSCKVGNNSTPAQRTDTGLIGTQTAITHASTVFGLSAEQPNTRLMLMRDFNFDPATTPTTYREACVGCFGIQNITDITVSRFVFPSDIIVQTGDRLRISYTLYVILNYLFNNVNISLSGTSLNFSGRIRSTSNDVGLASGISLANVGTNTTCVPFGSSNAYYFRTFTANTTGTTTATSFSNQTGTYTNIFNTANWANSLGFYTSAHTPAIYPTARTAYTSQGPLGTLTTTNIQQTDSYSSADVTYYFAPHTTSRSVSGVYLWRHDYSFSFFATYLNFDQNQIINAGTPVEFKLRWYFNR